MRLIQQCVCGLPVNDERAEKFEGLLVAPCESIACGTVHQVTDELRADYEAQYLGPYHAALDRHPGCVPYAARYEHDVDVARRRVRRYSEVLGIDFRRIKTALDVGAANGAWVNVLRMGKIDATGVDPDPAMCTEHVVTSRRGVRAIDPIVGGWDLVTFHDVLEHVVDPRTELGNAVARTAHLGTVVVDVPDVFEPQGAGRHHFKPEHLWFFTREALEKLFTEVGLVVIKHDRPIRGKLVLAGYRP